MSWTKLGLHKWIQDQLEDLKITTPTEIQRKCIPEILGGKDCVGCAKTGSGKTAAFALPILNRLSEDPYGVCALVLTPTRELASQIADQFNIIGKNIRVKVSLVVGGESCALQSIRLAQKPHVVVATPGRLSSLLQENSDVFHFKRLKFLVLDEVDALLTPGDFENHLSIILNNLPGVEYRQTLAFSATSNNIVDLLSKSLKNTLFIYIDNDLTLTCDKLMEYYLKVEPVARDSYLIYILLTFLHLTIELNDSNNSHKSKYIVKNDETFNSTNKQGIIFCSSLWQTHTLSRLLANLGFKCSTLHSALTQTLRTTNLAKFRSKHTRILIATSLAGRGLDIPSVDLVINYDDYIHHVGRTARAGKSGTSITFITPYELDLLAELENTIGKNEAEKYVKSSALMRKEISTNLYINEESKLNRKIEKRKKLKKHKIMKV